MRTRQVNASTAVPPRADQLMFPALASNNSQAAAGKEPSSPKAPVERSCIEDHPGAGRLQPFDFQSRYNRSFFQAVKDVPKDTKSYWNSTCQHGFYRALVQSVGPKLLYSWHRKITSEMVLNVHEDAKDVIQADAIWAVKHETTPDFINVLPALVAMNEGKPALKGIMKTLDMKKEPALWLLSQPVRPFSYQVKRPRLKNVSDPKRVREAKQYNADIVASARRHLQDSNQPTQVLIFPEGTTYTDGSVSYLHNGVFEISRDGAPVVPVGLNYDLIAGEKRPDSKYKYRVFMNVGKPFYYKPEKKQARGWALVKDRIMHLVKKMPQEREVFREYLSDRIIKLQTITAGGLIGYELIKLKEQGSRSVNKSDISRIVRAKAKALEGLSPIDPALLKTGEAEGLIERAWKNLCDMGYLSPEGKGDVATLNWQALDRDTSSPDTTVDPKVVLLKRVHEARASKRKSMNITLVDLIVATKRKTKILESTIGKDQVDADLQTNAAVIRKVGIAWKEMCRDGWISEGEGRSGTINVEAFIENAQKEEIRVPGRPYRTYKKDNPLRFCANSLLQKAKSDERIDEVLRGETMFSQTKRAS